MAENLVVKPKEKMIKWYYYFSFSHHDIGYCLLSKQFIESLL